MTHKNHWKNFIKIKCQIGRKEEKNLLFASFHFFPFRSLFILTPKNKSLRHIPELALFRTVILEAT
jgi:hypothetical protein